MPFPVPNGRLLRDVGAGAGTTVSISHILLTGRLPPQPRRRTFDNHGSATQLPCCTVEVYTTSSTTGCNNNKRDSHRWFQKHIPKVDCRDQQLSWLCITSTHPAKRRIPNVKSAAWRQSDFWQHRRTIRKAQNGKHDAVLYLRHHFDVVHTRRLRCSLKRPETVVYRTS